MAPITLSSFCLLASLTTSALAAPAPKAPARCSDFGECVEVEIFGYKTERLVSNNTSSLSRRQDEGNTNVEVGNDQVEQRTIAFQDDTPPDAVFGQLWDRIGEACLGSVCDESRPVEADGYQLSVAGQFPNPEARDNFFTLLREAFFRTLTVEESAEVITTPGPSPGIPGGQMLQKNKDTRAVDFLNANIFGGANSGQFMTVRISRVASSPGCGPAVNAINAAGALVPQLAPFFGGISVICAAIGG